ncbi:MAG: Hsp20/alpha crystallin family protein [Epsilonproteobacteria bacterium]|nr:Hsp20/alpha crystallin family protein [Campylobacterota bacterium]
MNKNIIIAIGFILVAIIGYQAYLLNKTEPKEEKIIPKDEPEITLNIEKKSIEKRVKELNQPQTNLTPNTPETQAQIDPDEMFDEELIKEDINKLFRDIFGNPKLQEGIKQGMAQMQTQLQEGLKEMEKNLGNLTQEFDRLSENDPFFKDLLSGFAQTKRLQFTDRGDDYYLKLNIPGGADSKIDIKTKENLLTLTIIQKIIEEQQTQNSTVHTERMKQHQNILLIPDDAFIDQLTTKYQDGTLEITIPKITKVDS